MSEAKTHPCKTQNKPKQFSGSFLCLLGPQNLSKLMTSLCKKCQQYFFFKGAEMHYIHKLSLYVTIKFVSCTCGWSFTHTFKEELWHHIKSGWKFTSDFYMMKLSWCTLWWKFTHDPFSKYRWIFIQSVRCTKTRMWQFFKLLIHQHTSCQHVAKRAVAKVKKFSRRSSKMEGVMNF